MNKEPQFRHEFKYLCSVPQLELLKSRITPLMQPDAHVGPTGQYTIRSLYFDSITDRCFYENENGTDPREKFRIRIYNGSDARISLECKRKERAKTLKTSCLISRAQCEMLMRSEVPPDVGENQTVLRQLAILMRTELFSPKVIVEYDRVPFVYPLGNVRVTFDRNIRSSTDVPHFLEKEIYCRPILPAGQHLLEVKYDEFLPDFIKESLEIGSLAQTAFSKYYLCRKFSTGGCL